MAPPFSILAERWYGWQMLPGYGPSDWVVPYFSPIYVRGLRRHPNFRPFTLATG
jgi:hypothetical protein